VPHQANDLIARHWPGALTVICKIQPSLRMDLGDSEDTIALRVPDHDLTREVLRRTGPMAVSSANLSGQPAALSCDEAIAQLGDSVAVYLDGGTLTTGGGAPSTIVDFTQRDEGEVLRVGALALEVLRETLPELTDLTEPLRSEPVEDAELDPATGSEPVTEDADPDPLTDSELIADDPDPGPSTDSGEGPDQGPSTDSGHISYDADPSPSTDLDLTEQSGEVRPSNRPDEPADRPTQEGLV